MGLLYVTRPCLWYPAPTPGRVWWQIPNERLSTHPASLCPANERRRYKVTTSLIGWAQPRIIACFIHNNEAQLSPTSRFDRDDTVRPQRTRTAPCRPGTNLTAHEPTSRALMGNTAPSCEFLQKSLKPSNLTPVILRSLFVHYTLWSAWLTRKRHRLATGVRLQPEFSCRRSLRLSQSKC